MRGVRKFKEREHPPPPTKKKKCTSYHGGLWTVLQLLPIWVSLNKGLLNIIKPLFLRGKLWWEGLLSRYCPPRFPGFEVKRTSWWKQETHQQKASGKAFEDDRESPKGLGFCWQLGMCLSKHINYLSWLFQLGAQTLVHGGVNNPLLATFLIHLYFSSV